METSMKIDLDELEKIANATPERDSNDVKTPIRAITLALIARIRELETLGSSLANGDLVGHVTADRARRLLEKGAVLP